MFLLLDIEDLIREYPEHVYAGTPAGADKTHQLQLLEVGSDQFAEGLQRRRARPHPALVAQDLSDLTADAEIPQAGINIPETGQ